MSSRYRLLDQLKGVGKIFVGDQFLFQAGYSLTIRQEYASADRETLPGHLEIDGSLTGRKTLEDLEPQNDETLTLHLADGRRLNFLLLNARTGRIKGTGDFY